MARSTDKSLVLLQPLPINLTVFTAIIMAFTPLYGQNADTTHGGTQLKYPVTFNINKMFVPAKLSLAEGVDVHLSIGKPINRPSDAAYFLFGYGGAEWGNSQKNTADEGRNEISYLFAVAEYRRTWPIFKEITAYLSGGGGVGGIKWISRYSRAGVSGDNRAKDTTINDTFVGTFSAGVSNGLSSIEYRTYIWQKPGRVTHSLGLNANIAKPKAFLQISTALFAGKIFFAILDSISG